MVHLFKKSSLLLILYSFVYSLTSTNDIDNVDWHYDQSMQQGFYFFMNIQIESVDIDPGSVVGPNDGVWECPDGDCDIIGAFYNNVCIGWTYPYYNNGYTVPVMIDDGTDQTSGYLSPGDIPEFRLYDNSTNTVYYTNSDPEIPAVYNNSFNIVENLFSNQECIGEACLNFDLIDLPSVFNITDIYPNPFNASTTISYSLPSMSNIKINIFNVLGQEVETLLNTDQLPGFHSITWDAGDIPSGFYIIRLNDNANTISKKVLLVK